MAWPALLALLGMAGGAAAGAGAAGGAAAGGAGAAGAAGAGGAGLFGLNLISRMKDNGGLGDLGGFKVDTTSRYEGPKPEATWLEKLQMGPMMDMPSLDKYTFAQNVPLNDPGPKDYTNLIFNLMNQSSQRQRRERPQMYYHPMFKSLLGE